MKKQEIIKSLRAANDGAEFITITNIARYCGKSRAWVRQQITPNLEYLKADRTKSYYIGDIAERIVRNLQS